MSTYIEENKLTPIEAMNKGLDAGSAVIRIEKNNGALEVTNANGNVLLQAKNVPAGIWTALWGVLEACEDIDFRAKG